MTYIASLSISTKLSFPCVLFLTALFGYHVGCTKAKQNGNAAAERSILIARLFMARENRRH